MRNKTLDVRFTWAKPELNSKPGRKWGFEWIAKKEDVGLRWISEKTGGHGERYSPHPGLFRDFADLRDRVEILVFANTHGDILGMPGSESRRVDFDGDGLRTVRRYAWLSIWEQEIRRMRHAVRLWDASNTGARKARLDAKAKLQTAIASAIQDRTMPRCTIMYLNPQHELIATPVNLLAFMWLTLARLASGEIAEQPCLGKSKMCVGYLYTGIGPGLMKTGTTTCSIACRKEKSRRNG